MINIENWRKLQDQLLVMDGNFDMGHWLKPDRPGETAEEAILPECRTVACLAGTAYLLALLEEDPQALISAAEDEVEFTARKWLGLNDPEAEHVFYGHWSPVSKQGMYLCRISRQDAIEYVKEVIRQGSVYIGS
jgi:hypothetical protein